MNNYKLPKKSRRGSALITVVIVCSVLALLAASSLNYSLQSYRNTMRQNLLDQAKLTAEGEMDFLFFKWKNELLSLTSESLISEELENDSIVVDYNDVITDQTTPATDDSNWVISRAIRLNGTPRTGQTIVSGSTRTSQVSYFTALTRAQRNHPQLGIINYQIGRRFAVSKTSLFQFSVFYQDTMEFSTGSAMTIKGDISSNGDIFMGSLGSTNRLRIIDKIFFAQSFNGAETATDAIDEDVAIYFRPNSTIPNQLVNPIFNSDADQEVARGNQIKKLENVENFIGGTDIDIAMAQYGPTGTGAYSSENDVYRSVVAPQPRDISGNLINEDPSVKAARMSQKAGLIIEVRSTTDPLYATSPVRIYTPSAPTVDLADPAFIATIIPDVRKPVFDTRENTEVNTTIINIGALKDALAASGSAPIALKNAYNGIVYAYDPNPQSQASGGTPAVLNGIRLENAAILPYTEVAGKPQGFTIASDNGIYIKGNYNTATTAGNPVNTTVNAGNPAAIIGDAITLLSENWDDTKATGNVQTERIATSTTVYAGLLTGNTPTNTTTGVNSGGVQNLIRLMENWNGQNVKIVGSLGQLFKSKYFTGAIRATGPAPDRNLYMLPGGRELTFDTKLASAPPAGSPPTTYFARGDYFIWQLGENPSSL
jgi:hypothetical protein